MKVSENWLREWVNPDVSGEQLGERLTMAGLELDAMDTAAPDLDGVVVARIEAIEPHPDADRLKVCRVNAGDNQSPRQVVCGAPNVRVDMLAAFAIEGTVLPNGSKIEATQLRGVDSSGMLCSSAELGLDEDAEGLLELDTDLTVGESLTTALQLDDIVFDIDLTPNRADCLSIQGVAREVSALYQVPLTKMVPKKVAADCEDKLQIKVQANEQCPRYCGRVIKNVDTSALTPAWMREKLRRSGIRSISIIVDICNYVMLELGQPMHAFDLNKLSDYICVRMAHANEKLTLLDDREITLDTNSLVIADSNKALALAGVMGGLDSAVQLDSSAIFLESAYFDALAIAGKARSFGLHTESSHRFERGVDPELAALAIERATALIKEYAGGAAGPVCEIVDSANIPQPANIALDLDTVRRTLGIEISAQEIGGMMENLGCEVAQTSAAAFLVIPPSYRFDLAIDADLVEEVARTRGYDQMPTAPMAVSSHSTAIKNKSTATFGLQQQLAALGYNEAVTFSFTEAKYCGLFTSAGAKSLANPISSELATMRTSLWPGLCLAANYNLKRQQPAVKLFESGRKYIERTGGIDQIDVVAGVATGQLYPRQWGLPARSCDFYDVKGDLAWLFQSLGIGDRVQFCPSTEVMGLHPGKTVQIYFDQTSIGVLGGLHPNVANQLNLPNKDVVVFELGLNELTVSQPARQFQGWSKFPSVPRDLTFTVDQSVPVQAMLDKIYSLQINQLQNIVVFAVYQGKGVPEGRKSVSLGLILQDFSSTLTDKQVEQIMTNIISLLADSFEAQLRNA